MKLSSGELKVKEQVSRHNRAMYTQMVKSYLKSHFLFVFKSLLVFNFFITTSKKQHSACHRSVYCDNTGCHHIQLFLIRRYDVFKLKNEYLILVFQLLLLAFSISSHLQCKCNAIQIWFGVLGTHLFSSSLPKVNRAN